MKLLLRKRYLDSAVSNVAPFAIAALHPFDDLSAIRDEGIQIANDPFLVVILRIILRIERPERGMEPSVYYASQPPVIELQTSFHLYRTVSDGQPDRYLQYLIALDNLRCETGGDAERARQWLERQV